MFFSPLGSLPLADDGYDGGVIPTKNFWIKISGIWKQATPYVKIAGVWKLATPYIKIGGVWK